MLKSLFKRPKAAYSSLRPIVDFVIVKAATEKIWSDSLSLLQSMLSAGGHWICCRPCTCNVNG
jgi:hypothetical protein